MPCSVDLRSVKKEEIAFRDPVHILGMAATGAMNDPGRGHSLRRFVQSAARSARFPSGLREIVRYIAGIVFLRARIPEEVLAERKKARDRARSGASFSIDRKVVLKLEPSGTKIIHVKDNVPTKEGGQIYFQSPQRVT